MAPRRPKPPRAPASQRRSESASYDVRIYAIRKKERKRGTAFEVRWQIAGRTRGKTFTTKGLADSFRSTLLVAARAGEPFDLTTGEPLSRLPVEAPPTTWWEWMLDFVDIKWPALAPSSRLSLAEGLASVTLAMLSPASDGPSAADIRTVVRGWACNARRRADGMPPPSWIDTLRWVERHTLPLTVLDDPAKARAVLDSIAQRLDGRPAAATTIARKRAVFYNAMEYAVERQLLASNPLDRIRWRAPKVADAIDPRSVINPQQASALLDAVAAQGRTGQHLVAFFGCMYYSALRPSEALALRIEDLRLPKAAGEWGELLLTRNNPQISGAWTDEGRRTARHLKHRAHGDVRRVPAPPQLVALLKAHTQEFCQDGDGRVFRGAHLADLQAVTYTKIWQRARAAALTPADTKLGLARRPYDLRHAAVSTWLAAGVDSVRVAEWAGHSVQVLHRVYAHVVDGGDDQARRRIQRRLGQCSPSESPAVDSNS